MAQGEQFQKEQRAIAEANQRLLEARTKWAEAMTKVDEKTRIALEAKRQADHAYEEVEAATAQLIELITEEPTYDTLAGRAANINKLQREIRDLRGAAHVGSSNQGKVSTHR